MRSTGSSRPYDAGAARCLRRCLRASFVELCRVRCARPFPGIRSHQQRSRRSAGAAMASCLKKGPGFRVAARLVSTCDRIRTKIKGDFTGISVPDRDHLFKIRAATLANAYRFAICMSFSKSDYAVKGSLITAPKCRRAHFILPAYLVDSSVIGGRQCLEVAVIQRRTHTSR